MANESAAQQKTKLVVISHVDLRDEAGDLKLIVTPMEIEFAGPVNVKMLPIRESRVHQVARFSS